MPSQLTRAVGGAGAATFLPDDWIARFGAAYRAQNVDWAASLARNTLTGPSAYDGYANNAVVHAALRSARDGSDRRRRPGPARFTAHLSRGCFLTGERPRCHQRGHHDSDADESVVFEAPLDRRQYRRPCYAQQRAHRTAPPGRRDGCNAVPSRQGVVSRGRSATNSNATMPTMTKVAGC